MLKTSLNILAVSSLESDLGQERENMDHLEYNMKCDLSDVREELEDCQKEATFLRQYKGGYDELEAGTVPILSFLSHIS